MFWHRYGLPVCCVQSVRGLVQYRHRMLIALAKHGAARPNPTTQHCVQYATVQFYALGPSDPNGWWCCACCPSRPYHSAPVS
jgi:hypothetical protein